MIRVAIGSSGLIYAELEPDSEKGTRSTELILRAAVMASYRRKCSEDFFGSFSVVCRPRLRLRCSRPRSTEARWLADPHEQRAASFEAARCARTGG